jgi:hypothetical protein
MQLFGKVVCWGRFYMVQSTIRLCAVCCFLLLQLAGDGFSEAADIRRRALDLVFLSYMREQAEQQQQQQRHKQLVAGGAAAGPAAGNAAAAGFTGGSVTGRPGSPSKAARLLQRRAAGIAGPDVSSWEGLWCSLTAMSGRRVLPLLQVGGGIGSAVARMLARRLCGV